MLVIFTQSKVTLEGDKLVETQKFEGDTITVTREVVGDEMLSVSMRRRTLRKEISFLGVNQ